MTMKVKVRFRYERGVDAKGVVKSKISRHKNLRSDHHKISSFQKHSSHSFYRVTLVSIIKTNQAVLNADCGIGAGAE